MSEAKEWTSGMAESRTSDHVVRDGLLSVCSAVFWMGFILRQLLPSWGNDGQQPPIYTPTAQHPQNAHSIDVERGDLE